LVFYIYFQLGPTIVYIKRDMCVGMMQETSHIRYGDETTGGMER
jgi:hypothetical protein